MPRLLIYAPSYRRLAAQIDAVPGVTALLMEDDGRVSEGGRTLAPEEVRADCAWTNGEVWNGPASRAFGIAVLKAEGLKWMQSGAAGFDNPIFGKVVSRGVRLTTSHGQALGMAEYVLAGVLDHFQHGPERRAAQGQKAWRRVAFREVLDSRWLIIGFGAIGQAVAERARGFGARITAVRRDQAAHPLAERIAPMSEISGLLPDADVVVLCTPLTPETRHMVDANFLAAMKPGSVLVNVGRGGLVDEPALLAALDRGVPEHAVLDVFETEPLPEDSPFWSHPRVAMTPHASGITDGQNRRNDALFLENLRRFAAGEPLLHEAKPADVLAG